MSWEFSFDIEKVDKAEFREWLLDSYPDARCSESWRGVQVDYFDGLEDSFEGDEFFSFLDAVEARFPDAKYEAAYEETTRVTDSRLVDVEVSYDGKRSVKDNVEQDEDDLASMLEKSGFAYLVDRDDLWNDEQIEPVAHVDEGFVGFVNELVWDYVDDKAAVQSLEKCDVDVQFMGFLMAANWIGGKGNKPEWCRKIQPRHLSSALKAAQMLGYADYQAVIQEMMGKEGVELEIVGKKAGRDVVEFGHRLDDPSDPLRWLVLAREEGRALLLTERAVCKRAYNEKRADVTWETCDLRAWLNGEFLGSFSDEERAKVALTHGTNPDNENYGAEGGADTDDYVFLLSVGEAEGLFASDQDRILDEDVSWWLRSPGYYADFAAYVFRGGDVDSDGYDVDRGSFAVRPALWLNL